MKVFVDRCPDYAKSKKVIGQAFKSLGGIERFFEKGETILVKPNLLQGANPIRAISTHPDFIIAVVELLEEYGVEVIVGDSPGGPMSKGRLEKFYKNSKWDRIEDETDARLNYNTDDVTIRVPEGRVIKSVDALGILTEVDGVLNLPKLKTHNLTVFTGAVKNNYGMVYGLTKSAYHGSFRGQKNFSKLLLDIYDMVNPRISIMDGILGMQGAGPASGDPINLDLVFASESAVACDIAACRSVGIPINKVPTIKLSDITEDEIEYVHMKPSDFDKKINYPEGGSTPWWAPDFLANLLSNFYRDRPVLDKDRCVRCAECLDVCPSDAIRMKNYGPKISWLNCIRCYCCTEACPYEALNRK